MEGSDGIKNVIILTLWNFHTCEHGVEITKDLKRVWICTTTSAHLSVLVLVSMVLYTEISS